MATTVGNPLLLFPCDSFHAFPLGAPAAQTRYRDASLPGSEGKVFLTHLTNVADILIA